MIVIERGGIIVDESSLWFLIIIVINFGDKIGFVNLLVMGVVCFDI